MNNIIIPMAGRGSRFVAKGYELPKPLIDVNGKPMIEMVIDSIHHTEEDLFVFLVLQEHLKEYYYMIHDLFKRKNITYQIVPVDRVTQGAACTILLADPILANRSHCPTWVVNSDQAFSYKHNDFDRYMHDSNATCGILTFYADHPKWSYAILDNNNRFVEKVVEKELTYKDSPVINGKATIGAYYIKHYYEMKWAISQMIKKNIRVNNEFYFAPSINELINIGLKVVAFDVENMIPLGTPEDLEIYLAERM